MRFSVSASRRTGNERRRTKEAQDEVDRNGSSNGLVLLSERGGERGDLDWNRIGG